MYLCKLGKNLFPDIALIFFCAVTLSAVIFCPLPSYIAYKYYFLARPPTSPIYAIVSYAEIGGNKTGRGNLGTTDGTAQNLYNEAN